MAALIATMAGGRRRRRRFMGSTFDPLTCALVDDTEVRTPSAPPKPAYLDSIVDPDYGTTITRIVGDPGTAIGDTGQVWPSTHARHFYPKAATWNADESLMRLTRVGTLTFLYLDGHTYQPLYFQSPAGEDSRWHPTEPPLLISMTASGPLIRHRNVPAASVQTVVTLSGYSSCWYNGEGNPSRDGDFLAVNAIRNSDSKTVVFAIQISSQTKFPDLDLAALGFTSLDWASISPLGDYIVVNGTIAGGELGGSGLGDHTQVFDLEGNPVGDPWLVYGRPSHYDLGFDTTGAQVAVGTCKRNPGDGRVLMRRLVDGLETFVSGGGYPTHSSCRAANIPWVFCSHQGFSSSFPPYSDEFFMCHLSPDKVTVLRLGSAHGDRNTPEHVMYASPSPSGTRVIFASNWRESGPDDVPQSYVCDLRAVCRL
jgi:hypothetical protein